MYMLIEVKEQVILDNQDTLIEFKRKRLSLATCRSKGSDSKLANIAYYKFINRSITFLQYTPYPVAAGYCIISSKAAFNKIGGFDPDVYLAEDTTYILRGRKKRLRFRVLKSQPIKVSNRRLNSEGTYQLPRPFSEGNGKLEYLLVWLSSS